MTSTSFSFPWWFRFLLLFAGTGWTMNGFQAGPIIVVLVEGYSVTRIRPNLTIHTEKKTSSLIRYHPPCPLFSQRVDENTSAESSSSSSEASTSTSKTTRKRSILFDLARDLHHLSVLRPNRWTADFSAPPTLISAGSSYTRLWTHETWKKHDSSYPHIRYFRHVRRWPSSTTAQKVMRSSIVASVWACIVAIGYTISSSSSTMGYFSKASKGATAALSALTAPLALLLTLRTNASLARLSETRVAWGRLVLHVRQVTSLLRSHVWQSHPEATALAARYLAVYGWCLKGSLRGEGSEKEQQVLQTIFGNHHPAELEWLSHHPRPVWAIVGRLRHIVGSIATTTSSSPSSSTFLVPHERLEDGISSLEGVAGICERILGSPIPPTYSRHLSRVLCIWLGILPLGLMGSGIPMVGTIFATGFTSYVLIGLDEIGMEIEHPFPLLPLQQLAGAAQNAVSMQLMDYECNPGIVVPVVAGEVTTAAGGDEPLDFNEVVKNLSIDMPDVPLQ